MSEVKDWLEDVIMDASEPMHTFPGLDAALIGYIERFGEEPVALYDMEHVMAILMEDDMTYEEAAEYFDYNIIGYGVENAPAFATLYRRNDLD